MELYIQKDGYVANHIQKIQHDRNYMLLTQTFCITRCCIKTYTILCTTVYKTRFIVPSGDLVLFVGLMGALLPFFKCFFVSNCPWNNSYAMVNDHYTLGPKS